MTDLKSSMEGKINERQFEIDRTIIGTKVKRKPIWHWQTFKAAFTTGRRKADYIMRWAPPAGAGTAIVWDDRLKLSEIPHEKILWSLLVIMGVLFIVRMRDLSRIGRELVQQQKFTVDALRCMTTTLDQDLKRIDITLNDHEGRIKALEEPAPLVPGDSGIMGE